MNDKRPAISVIHESHTVQYLRGCTVEAGLSGIKICCLTKAEEGSPTVWV